MYGDGTHDSMMGGGEERGAPGGPPRDSRDRDGDGRHPHKDAKEVVCRDGAREYRCHCRHVDFLIGSYPEMGKDALIQRIDKLDDTSGGILEDQAIFDNALKSIRSHQEYYEAKLETMLVQQQGMVDKMINHLEIVEDRMKELERRAEVPGPGPDLPRDPAPESLVRRLTTLRTAAEGVAPMEGPMESAPYGPPRVDPSLLRHIPILSASVMFREETPEKGSVIGTPKRDTHEGMVEIDISSPPAAGMFGSRAAYERRVAKMDSEMRGGSSWESSVQDLRLGIWTMVGPGMEETKSGPREDMEIRGVYSHSPGHGSGGSIRLGAVIASDVGDAVRIEDLRGVKIPHYNTNPANSDDFILDWEYFAEEVVGEMRFGSDAGGKWACCTFPHLLAPKLKAELRDAIQERMIRTEEQCLDWLEQEERVDTPNQKLDDLWAIPLNFERGELRLREWRRYLRKYRPLLKQVEDWSESGEIRHILRDVLQAYLKKRVEDEQKKWAKKRMAVHIMSPDAQHPGIIEYFRRNFGSPERMISLKNSVYVEVFGETAGGRLLRLSSVEWRSREKLKLQIIPARRSLGSITQYVSIEQKLNSKKQSAY